MGVGKPSPIDPQKRSHGVQKCIFCLICYRNSITVAQIAHFQTTQFISIVRTSKQLSPLAQIAPEGSIVPEEGYSLIGLFS